MVHEPNYTFNMINIPGSNVHGAHMGPTWVLSALDGPHVGPMTIAISDALCCKDKIFDKINKSLGEGGVEAVLKNISSDADAGKWVR